ncbi:MAG TPA: hypothetical protein VL404_08305 [Candidatus Eisenbacteria bacterium]|nr:hypothetical protein [Candidatus Eisenbacteria bacterium]
MRKKGRGGFTLVEILVTVVFLAMGTLMIQEGFLRSASIYARYANSLKARIWMNEKLWEARASVLFSAQPFVGSDEGVFTSGSKPFHWKLQADQRGSTLYAVKLQVDWLEDGRPVFLEREVYAAKPKLAG